MSVSITVDVPGLTRPVAIEFDRRANLACAPFAFRARHRASLRKVESLPTVEMEDLREDPSIASETLDHPDAWPQDAAVREWLTKAIGFLATNAPERLFGFHAGWNDHEPAADVGLDLEAFLAMIAAGQLRASDHYTVRV